MMIKRVVVGAAFSLIALGALWFASEKGERRFCVSHPLSQNDGEVGFEIVNPLGKEVWATRDWAPESFAGFSFPLHWLLWRKNDPRRLTADTGQILRSPGCDRDGEYNRLRAFGRDFIQPVRLITLGSFADKERHIRKVTLEKYHALTFKSGREIIVLNAPDGARYIFVARTALERSPQPTLPPDWQLTTHVLKEDLTITLSGIVEVLRTDNRDSFQGPISRSVRFDP